MHANEGGENQPQATVNYKRKVNQHQTTYLRIGAFVESPVQAQILMSSRTYENSFITMLLLILTRRSRHEE